jgi:hypothetical protein
VQAIASVVFADLLAFQLQQIFVGPALHRLTVIVVPGVDQYVKLISDWNGAHGCRARGCAPRR